MYKDVYSHENMTKPPKKSYFETRIPSVAIARKTPKSTDFSKRKAWRDLEVHTLKSAGVTSS